MSVLLGITTVNITVTTLKEVTCVTAKLALNLVTI